MSKTKVHLEEVGVRSIPHLSIDVDLDHQYEVFMNEQHDDNDIRAYYEYLSFEDYVDRINFTKS